jgi:hypothetical protein
VSGIVHFVDRAVYATSIGLLQWAARVVTTHEPVRYESAPAGGSIGRMRDWLRQLFP